MEKIKTGIYRIAGRDLDSVYGIGRYTEHLTYHVAKGESVNEEDTGIWERIYGLTASKWYAAKVYSVTVEELGRADDQHTFRPTVGRGSKAIADMFPREFDTRSEAIEFLNDKYGRQFDEEY